jgi:hypothetical protein
MYARQARQVFRASLRSARAKMVELKNVFLKERNNMKPIKNKGRKSGSYRKWVKCETHL